MRGHPAAPHHPVPRQGEVPAQPRLPAPACPRQSASAHRGVQEEAHRGVQEEAHQGRGSRRLTKLHEIRSAQRSGWGNACRHVEAAGHPGPRRGRRTSAQPRQGIVASPGAKNKSAQHAISWPGKCRCRPRTCFSALSLISFYLFVVSSYRFLCRLK